MTIQELKEKKQALEKEIAEKIREFCIETGAASSIHVYCTPKCNPIRLGLIENINIRLYFELKD